MSKVWYQGILKATNFWVFEDLKLKISEGSDQNWSFPDSALLAVSAKTLAFNIPWYQTFDTPPNVCIGTFTSEFFWKLWFLKHLLYFLKMCPIFVASIYNLGRSDDDIILWKNAYFQ